MNVVIIGAGKLGTLLTKHLSQENHDVVIIDKNSQVVDELVSEYDAKGYYGNGANYDTQIEAGVGLADLVISVVSLDELNIFACLVAKKIGAKHTIARVRNPEYAKQISFMNQELGINLVINPELDTAEEISRMLRFPSALKVETFANGKVELIEIKVSENSPLVGSTLMNIRNKTKIDILVCAVKRNDEVIIPNGEFQINAFDNIYVTAEAKEIIKFFKYLNLSKERSKRILIVGGSKIAQYLTKDLNDLGLYVKVIDINRDTCKSLSNLFPQLTIINGDATNQKLLLEEGITTMDALISLTGMDETNIIISSYAKTCNVDKIITKVNNSNYNLIIEQIGLNSVVSPKEISSNNIVRFVRGLESSQGSEFLTLHRFVDNKVEALEFFIQTETNYTNIPIKDLSFKDNILLACIIRDNKVIIPQGKDYISRYDRIIIFTTNPYIKDVKDILRWTNEWFFILLVNY